jgi:hypothetical protein
MESKQLVSLATAMDDVTPQEFCVWLKLHLIPSDDLNKPMAQLAKACQYSLPRFGEILRTLSAKGYVVVHKKGPPGPTLVTVEKRASLSGVHRISTPSNQPSKDR